MRRREILARQPSYCKILNDLKEVESSESEEQELAGETAETKQEKSESEVRCQRYKIYWGGGHVRGCIFWNGIFIAPQEAQLFIKKTVIYHKFPKIQVILSKKRPILGFSNSKTLKNP